MRREKWSANNKLVYFHKRACFLALIYLFIFSRAQKKICEVAITTAVRCTVVLSKSIHEDKTIIKNTFHFVFQDEAILETTDHITEFTSKFKKLESALRAAKMEEFSLHKEKQDLKLRLKELILETNKLKGKCLYGAPSLVWTGMIPFHSGKYYILF